MAEPVANFTFTPTGLSIQFTDLSLNIPVSFDWDFGDTNSSTDQNPLHVYATGGSFTVRLTATNADGSNQVIRTINVSVNPILPLSISDIVNCKVPAAVTLDQLCKDNYIAEWQLFLAPLVDPKIPDVSVFIETAWPPLVNMLIAQLTCYSLLLDAAQQANLASSVSTSGTGPIKALKTGPSEAEWFNNSDILKDVFKEHGLFQELRNEACQLASRLRVNLPFCDKLTQGPFIFKVEKRRQSVKKSTSSTFLGSNSDPINC